MPWHHGQEALEGVQGHIRVPARLREADDGFHHGEPDLGRPRADGARECDGRCDQVIAARQTAAERAASRLEIARPELDLGQRELHRGVGGRRHRGERVAGARELLPGHRRSRQVHARLDVSRVRRQRLLQRVERLPVPPGPDHPGGNRTPLRATPGGLAGGVRIAGLDEGLHQHVARSLVAGMLFDGRLPAAHGIAEPARAEKRLSRRTPLLGGAGVIAEIGQHPCALVPAGRIARVDLRIRARRLGRCGPVAAPKPLLEERLQLQARVGRQALLRRQLRRAEQRRVVVGLDLDDPLVERRGLRDEALAGQVLGDARVLGGRLGDLAGPDVQVAQQRWPWPSRAGCSSTRRAYSAMAASRRPWRSSFSALLRVSSRSIGRVVRMRAAARRPTRSYQTATRAGTSGGDGASSRSARRRPGARAWRSPCAGRSRSAVVLGVQRHHQPIAVDLGDDRGGGDRRAEAVAVDDAALGHGQARECVNASTRTASGSGDEAHHRAPHGLAATRGGSRSDRCPPARPPRRPRPARRGGCDPRGARARPAAPAWSRRGRGCGGRGRRMTAPATTGPARQPRPTSSTPATWTKPTRRRAFSTVRVASTRRHGSPCRRDRGLRRAPGFLHAGGLALQLAQEVELRAADLGRPDRRRCGR